MSRGTINNYNTVNSHRSSHQTLSQGSHQTLSQSQISRPPSRLPSELLCDLHVYKVPTELWRENLNNILNNVVTETVSVGIIRVPLELRLAEIREEIVSQLQTDDLKDYVFLRSVGRSLTRLRNKQEYQLKAKHFLPPVAYAPELYILETSSEMRDAMAASDRSSQSPPMSRRTSPYNRGFNSYRNNYQGDSENERSNKPTSPSHKFQKLPKISPSKNKDRLNQESSPELKGYNPDDSPYFKQNGQHDPYIQQSSKTVATQPHIYHEQLGSEWDDPSNDDIQHHKTGHPAMVNQTNGSLKQHEDNDSDVADVNDYGGAHRKDNHDKNQRRTLDYRKMLDVDILDDETDDDRRRKMEDMEEGFDVDRQRWHDNQDFRKRQALIDKRREEEEREMERREKEEYERRQLEETRLNEERHLREEIERKRKEEMEEENRRFKEKEEQRKLEEAERRRKEEEKRRKEEEEKRRKEEEEKRRKEEERKRKEEEERKEIARLKEEDEMRNEEKRRIDEERRRAEERRKEEERVQKRLDEERRKDEERKKLKRQQQEELDIKLKEDQERQEEFNKQSKESSSSPAHLRDTESAKQRRRNEKNQLLKDIEDARQARQDQEKEREELVKRAKQMQHKTTNRRNEARDMWKKKYFEEKKKTAPLEENSNRLQQELEALHKKLMNTLEGPKEKNSKLIDSQPSLKNNYVIQCTKLQHEIEDIQRRVENARMKLTAEMKLRNQAQGELRALRAELNQRKLSMDRRRQEQLAALNPRLFEVIGSEGSHSKHTMETKSEFPETSLEGF